MGCEGMEMAPIETVVEDALRRIENRARHVFTPRRIRLAAVAPMVTRPLAEAVRAALSETLTAGR
jgi:hypothetical protein